MSAFVPQIRQLDGLFSRLLRLAWKKNNASITGPLWGETTSGCHRGFPTQRAIDVETVSMVWHRWLCARLQCIVHPGVRDTCRASEIDLCQPRYETAFWCRHNGPVTSQLTGPIHWPNYPLELIGIYVHINTHNNESLTQRCRRSINVQLCPIYLYISIWFESWWTAYLILHHK